MAKFQQGGSTAEQQQIMEFIQDIVTSPDKYASQGVSEEFLSAIATTMEQNPQGLNDVFTQYAEDVEKAAAVFKAGNQVVSQKLGGKMDYLHCLKNGGATPGCNCSGNVVKAGNGIPGVNEFIKTLLPGKRIKLSDDREIIPFTYTGENPNNKEPGFFMDINKATNDTTYNHGYMNGDEPYLDNRVDTRYPLYQNLVEAMRRHAKNVE